MRIAVMGATGFVGSAVVRAAVREGHEVIELPAPRLSCSGRDADSVRAEARRTRSASGLRAGLLGCGALINAAGVADAGTDADDVLFGANALMPSVLYDAAERAGVDRVIHISSAAVQGHAKRLTETSVTGAFSPYSSSKAVGEAVVVDARGVVIYRPTSVQGPGRPVTQKLVGLAGSRLSSVAGRGNRPTPQVHVDSVGSAAVFLAVCGEQPPKYVLHPWEGFTTRSLLETLGGRPPKRIPVALVAVMLSLARLIGRAHPGIAANARRLEMLWLGQDQEQSWLERAGWETPVVRTDWQRLGASSNKAC